MKSLKVLVLLHQSLVPPEKVTKKELIDASWRMEYYVIEALKNLGHKVLLCPLYDDLSPIRKEQEEFQPDIAFNMLEEFDGEAIFDANVVSYLELIKLRYTGCNPRGLILSRDKALSKKIMTYHRIPVPKFMTIPIGKKVAIKKMQYPLFVKSLNEEASLGISQASMVETESALRERVEFIHKKLQTAAIVEEFIEGRELYIGVMGNQRLQVFTPSELTFGQSDTPEKEFATRKVKWDEKYRKRNAIRSKVCENLSPELMRKIQHIVKKVYRVLDLNSYARIDIRLKGEVPYVIEANPNPAISPDDDFAFTAKHSGISYEDLIQKLLKLGMQDRKTS